MRVARHREPAELARASTLGANEIELVSVGFVGAQAERTIEAQSERADRVAPLRRKQDQVRPGVGIELRDEISTRRIERFEQTPGRLDLVFRPGQRDVQARL